MSSHESFVRADRMKPSSDRAFGVVFTGFFFLVALWPLWSGRPVRNWALVTSGAFLVVALLVPVLLRPLNLVWTMVGRLLHHVMNPLVLGILFYVVFTPFGAVKRMFGWDPLRLKPAPDVSTFWLPRQPPGPPPPSMKQQF